MRNRYIDARNEMLVILWSAVVISAFLLALFMLPLALGWDWLVTVGVGVWAGFMAAYVWGLIEVVWYTMREPRTK